VVNSRAESGYPARGIKMPSRDSQNVIVSLLLFYKTITKWFSTHLGCCSTFGMRKNTLACGSSIFTLSESLATSLVHGSRNPAREYLNIVDHFQGTYHAHIRQ
jgi:hypothetical protein